MRINYVHSRVVLGLKPNMAILPTSTVKINRICTVIESFTSHISSWGNRIVQSVSLTICPLVWALMSNYLIYMCIYIYIWVFWLCLRFPCNCTFWISYMWPVANQIGQNLSVPSVTLTFRKILCIEHILTP